MQLPKILYRTLWIFPILYRSLLIFSTDLLSSVNIYRILLITLTKIHSSPINNPRLGPKIMNTPEFGHQIFSNSDIGQFGLVDPYRNLSIIKPMELHGSQLPTRLLLSLSFHFFKFYFFNMV